MAEQATPTPYQRVEHAGDRETASRHPDQRRGVSEPDLGESDAARRQARQDPLQRRDR